MAIDWFAKEWPWMVLATIGAQDAPSQEELETSMAAAMTFVLGVAV